LESLIKRLAVLVVLLYAGLFIGAWLQKAAGIINLQNSIGGTLVATLSFQGAAIVLTAAFLRQHRVSWNQGFGFRNQWRQAVLFGMLAACIFLPLGWSLQEVSLKLVSRFSHSATLSQEQQAVQVLRIAISAWDRIALGTVTIFLAPTAEELLFRGILYPWVKQAGFPRLALWGTALLFAAIHANVVVFIPLFVLAVILTVLYEKTNNLLAPITAHALFNATNFVMLYLLDKQTT
jgi:membrane protease YdiL (CAAX protease family)